MKKSTIVAVCMLAAVGLRFSPVLAAEPALMEEEVQEFVWEDIEEVVNEADIPGEFVELAEPMVKFFLPEILEGEELTEEEQEDGLLGVYLDEEGEASVIITYLDMLCEDVYEYGDFIEEEYDTEVEYLRVNGMDAICYYVEEDDELCVAFVPEEDYVLEFAFCPMEDEAFYSLTQLMTASIQKL